jgi:hypothetical protein
MDEPGLNPMSPVILVAPVLVIVDPASTAKVEDPAIEIAAWFEV